MNQYLDLSLLFSVSSSHSENSSSDFSSFLDGKFNNIDSPDGVYIYTIKIKFAEDNELTENGTINLFR